MRKVTKKQCERTDGTKGSRIRRNERERERKRGGESGRESAQKMEAKIEARGNQAAMKDSAIQDTPKPRRASESWRYLPGERRSLDFFPARGRKGETDRGR